MCQRTGSVMGAGSYPSLRGDEPPVVRLTTAVKLDLGPLGDREWELIELDRRALTLDHGDQLGPLDDPLDRRRERRPGPTPGHHLLVREADRVAANEAALRVVARGGGDRPGADLAERQLEALCVALGIGLGI